MMSEIRCFGAGMECQCAKQWTDAGSRAEPQKSTWKSGPEQDGECDDVTGLGASFPGGRVLGVCASARVCMCVAMRWDGLGGLGINMESVEKTLEWGPWDSGPGSSFVPLGWSPNISEPRFSSAVKPEIGADYLQGLVY